MRRLTTYVCQPNPDVLVDVQRIIEVWIYKAGDEPAQVCYSPVAIANGKRRKVQKPAIVTATELMLAQAQAVQVLQNLDIANPPDPIIKELLGRYDRCKTRIIEGEISVDPREVYDVEDEGTTLQMLLAEMRGRGSRVACIELSDPDNLR
ncbi:MAG: hypothetical protein ACM3US_10750 [Sphingomonadaceae bacterium]